MKTDNTRSRPRSLKLKLLLILALYFVNILLFSAVYWTEWHRSPDFFIVNPEVNNLPIEALRLTLVDDQNTDFSTFQGYTSQFMGAETMKQLGSLKIRIDELTDQRDAANLRQRQAYDDSRERVEINFAKYLDQELQRFSVEDATIGAEIERISSMKSLSTEPNTRLTLTQRENELRIDRAELNVERAEKEYELRQEYFDNVQRFIEPEYRLRLETAANELNTVESELLETRNSYYALRQQAWQTFEETYSSRVKQLNFGDFLYFSLSVSTANTFGDILPNHKSVRFAVIFQLLLNIVLLSLLLSILADQLVKPNQQTT